MKKCFALCCLLIGMLILSFAAFAPAPAEGETLPEIVLWAKTGVEGDALEKAAYVYTRETGNPVKVLILGRSGFRQKYKTALAAGSTEVDGILDISRESVALAAGGMLHNMDEYILNAEGYELEDISPSILNEMKFDGHFYMVPTDTSLETLVYRTDLIEKAPETWDELVEVAKNFTKEYNPDSPTDYGYAFAGGPGVLTGTVLGIQHGYGANIVDEKMCVTGDSEEFVTAFTKLMNMRNVDKITPSDITAWDYQELLVALQEGIVPMAAFFSSGMETLYNCEESPNVCENIVMALQPAGPAGAFTRVNPLGIMVNEASERKDATWAFLEWLTNPTGALLYTQMGGTSPRSSVLSNPSLVEARPWLPTMEAVGANGIGTLRVAAAGDINTTFNKWADMAMAGELTPEEALHNCAEELRALLDEANNPACK